MKLIWRLVRLYRPYSGWMLLGILLSLLTVLANISLLALSGWFISSMALAGAIGGSMNYFTPAALIRGAAITRTAGRYGERLITHEATFRLVSELRVWFYEKLEPLAPAVLQQYRSGDVLSRIRADIDTLNNFYLRIFLPMIVALLATLIVVITLAYYQPLFAMVELGLLLIAGVVLPWLLNKLSLTTGAQLVQTAANLRIQLVSDLQGMGELLIYGAAEQQAQTLQQHSQALAAQQQRLNRLNTWTQIALSVTASLAMWLLLILAVPLVRQGSLAPANLAMLSLLALASFEAIAPLPLAWQSLGETLAAARRIFTLTEQASSVQEPEQPLPVPESFSLRFDQLSFRYQATRPWVLKELSFRLEPGQKLIILGANGSGKTSLLSVLLRFHEPTRGRLLLNEQPIQAYTGEAIRARLAVAEQHAQVFNSTLLDNLRLANPVATQAQIEQACSAVLLDEFIQQQPEGYHTWVGETGLHLSGGQLQRLVLARALLKPASVLILDEPTEGLDPETALSVMRNILAWVEAQGQSLLVITHQRLGIEAEMEVLRLSTQPQFNQLSINPTSSPTIKQLPESSLKSLSESNR